MKDTTHFIGLLGTGILAVSSIIGTTLYIANKETKLEKELEELTKTAISISAGEDRIWSDEEKINFLRENGLNNMVLQNGKVNFYYGIDKIKVYTDIGINSTMAGHTTITGENHVGDINRATLENYVNSHK